MDTYEDIIGLPHHQSERHPHMPLRDRAAQFAPFAALSGYEEAVTETARFTEERTSHSDGDAFVSELNSSLMRIKKEIASRPFVTVTAFVPDERKAGGTYVKRTGNVKKIDQENGCLVFTDGFILPLEDIRELCF